MYVKVATLKQPSDASLERMVSALVSNAAISAMYATYASKMHQPAHRWRRQRGRYYDVEKAILI
jgi:hypothetical protein